MVIWIVMEGVRDWNILSKHGHIHENSFLQDQTGRIDSNWSYGISEVYNVIKTQTPNPALTLLE